MDGPNRELHLKMKKKATSQFAPARLPARETFRSRLSIRRSLVRRSVDEGGFLTRVLIALVFVLAGGLPMLFAVANSSASRGAGSGARPNVSAQASSGAESAQWFWQNPLPQGNDLRGASFINGNTGTVVGYHGTIVRTTDGGNSWTIQSSGTTENLWAVSFTDTSNGTAVGEGGTILRTTNGGDNWVSQASGTTEQLRGVSFVDASSGTAVGGAGTILRTTDGGNTWIPQPSGTSDTLFGVFFIDANTGTAVGGTLGQSVILRTTDGGQNWVSQPNPGTTFLFDVSFTDANNGTAAGDQAQFSERRMAGRIGQARSAEQQKRFTEFRSAMQVLERFVVSNSAALGSF